jgi:hypothetical protein
MSIDWRSQPTSIPALWREIEKLRTVQLRDTERQDVWFAAKALAEISGQQSNEVFKRILPRDEEQLDNILALHKKMKSHRDYIEYMMGHTISAYPDIQMKGIEFLRGIYIASGLSVKPKTKINKIEALKEIIRAWGLNPEEILTKQALTEPHRTVIDRNQLEQSQLHQLTTALKQQMLKEIRESQGEKSMNSCLGNGSPGEILGLGL